MAKIRKKSHRTTKNRQKISWKKPLDIFRVAVNPLYPLFACIILLVCFLLPTFHITNRTAWACSATSPFYTKFTFMFQHANFFHWLINACAFFVVYRWNMKIQPLFISVIIPIACAAGVSFPAAGATASLGFSGVVFAMLGVYHSTCLFDRAILITKPRNFYFGLGLVILFFIVGFYLPQINNIYHVLSYFSAFFIIAAYSKRQHKKYQKKYFKDKKRKKLFFNL